MEPGMYLAKLTSSLVDTCLSSPDIVGTSFSPAVYGSKRSASDNDNDEGASWERSSEVLLQERRVETDVAGKPGGDGRQIVRTAEDLSQYPGWLGSRHSSSPLPWLRFVSNYFYFSLGPIGKIDSWYDTDFEFLEKLQHLR